VAVAEFVTDIEGMATARIRGTAIPASGIIGALPAPLLLDLKAPFST
jgi:hypothetical protein